MLEEVQSGELLKWEKVGTKLSGVLKNYHEQPTSLGVGNVYEVETSDGLIPFFAPLDLHRKLGIVPIGFVVDIEFKSTIKSKIAGKNDFKVFSVKKGEATEENLKSVGLEKLKKALDEEVEY